MKTTYFVYKEKNTDDRDCVKYIEKYSFECGHYFGGGNLTGACFSSSLRSENINYDEIETILTKEDFDFLLKADKELTDLGYGITENDEKYNKGMKIIEELNNRIFSKLSSKENEELFQKIIEEEKEYCKYEYCLDDEEVDMIFEEYLDRFSRYPLIYQDRAIISSIYNSAEELGEEYIENCTDTRLDNYTREYFDFEDFGESLAEDENYLTLESGRIVNFSL